MTTIKKQKKIDVAIGATRSKLAVIVREILKLEAKVEVLNEVVSQLEMIKGDKLLS